MEVGLVCEAWRQLVSRENAVACDCVLDGTWGLNVRKELQRVDPLGFPIAREKLLIEAYVPFGVFTSGGLSWGPLDGAVDGFVVEVFVDVSTVAGDARFWDPAVNVSTERVGGVRKEIH